MVLPLATRSLLFATLGGVAVPVVVVLESADAAALAARSADVLAELLPLLGAYYAAHIAERPAGGVAASGARPETLAGAFADGQVYVALSRVVGLEGLWLSGPPLRREAVRASASVAEFYARL